VSNVKADDDVMTMMTMMSAYSAPLDPLAGFKGAYFKTSTSKGRGMEERGDTKIIYVPSARNPRAATVLRHCLPDKKVGKSHSTSFTGWNIHNPT